MPSARHLLERLVAFDTTSSKSNLAMIEWVADSLDHVGLRCRLIHDEAQEKANLYATVGPDDGGGVVLSGHSDVVPVEGQCWSTDPFRVTERDGKLFGRGTADMKGFIACVLAGVQDLPASGLRTPLHLALSFDEEVGCLGVPRLIEAIGREPQRPALAIIGEPTEMQPVNAHKGVYAFETTVTGREAHSSTPEQGANAIAAAADIIGFLGALAEEWRARAADATASSGTTLNVGRITGGTALNTVAGSCRFVWEFRPAPQEDPSAIKARVEQFIAREALPRLRRGHPEATISTAAIAAVPALSPDPGSPAEALVRRLAGANAARQVSFGTEAGLFQKAGIPAVVCGPGSIEQAHRPDEFIAIEQLERATAFIARLMAWAADTRLQDALAWRAVATTAAP